jgi:hypothetical protein
LSEPVQIALHSLGGEAAPPDLGGDLRRLLRVSPEGLGKLWQVLGPCLGDKLTDETEKLLDVFCSAYGVKDDDLGRAIKACRFLIQAAAKLDVPRERFGDDLALLCPDAPVIQQVLLAGYEPIKRQLRQAAAMAAVLGHGKAVVNAEWRIDTIETSERGGRIRVPVTMLTLHYREGTEVGRVTLQLLPDVLEKLKAMCEASLS